MTFRIEKVDEALTSGLQHKINNKTKPPGSLGLLETLALRIGRIQHTVHPVLRKPTLVVFAGDHGIAAEGIVNPYPQEVTAQMVYNFLEGGAASNVFCRTFGLDMVVADAGVKHTFAPHPALLDVKMGEGTRNYRHEAAMTEEQCREAVNRGADIVRDLHEAGCNTIALGEMGIGNTSSAALIMSALTGIPVEDCTGRGTGLDNEALAAKKKILKEVFSKHGHRASAPEILAAFGGFEIAMLCGAFLRAAECRMIILVDGFIATTALLVASRMHAEVLDYCFFAHTSEEYGHKALLDHLDAQPILSLGMRLGEGTGAVLAYPVLNAAVAFLNQMASFEEAAVSNRS